MAISNSLGTTYPIEGGKDILCASYATVSRAWHNTFILCLLVKSVWTYFCTSESPIELHRNMPWMSNLLGVSLGGLVMDGDDGSHPLVIVEQPQQSYVL